MTAPPAPATEASPPPELSVVIPFHDERDNLEPLVRELLEVMEALGRSFEILLVDDASGDGGLELARRLAAGAPQLHLLHLARQRGQSAALAAGFAHARGELVVTLDADLQNDPRDLPALLELAADHDLVSGVRAKRRDSLLRRLSSRVANRVRDRVLHDGISDVGCSLKVMRAELLEGLPVFDGMHRFLPALLAMRGARTAEIAVNHRPRQHGVSKYGIRNRLWRGVLDLFGVRWLQARWLDVSRVEEIAGSPDEPRPPHSPAASPSP